MKKNKKRLIFMLLIIVMLMGIASSAFASATYAGTFKYRIYETVSSVSFNSYVRDINSFCKKYGEATYGSYESWGLYYDSDDDKYIRFRSCLYCTQEMRHKKLMNKL